MFLLCPNPPQAVAQFPDPLTRDNYLTACMGPKDGKVTLDQLDVYRAFMGIERVRGRCGCADTINLT